MGDEVEALRQTMNARRVSIRSLAVRSGVPYRSLQNYLAKKNPLPLAVLRRACEALGIEPSNLMGGKEERRDGFGPGTFGCHEALHTTVLLLTLIERELAKHPAVIGEPEWSRHVDRAMGALHELYRGIGAAVAGEQGLFVGSHTITQPPGRCF